MSDLASKLSLPSLESDSSAKPVVAIVIVNYNSCDYVLDCLKSLENLTFLNYFVVVVDNNSSDGSGQVLQKKLSQSRVSFIINPENKGFAAANNLGIKYAIEYDAEYIWLLNPDTTVHPESLSALIAAINGKANVGAVGSKVLAAKPHELKTEVAQGDTIWSAGARVDFLTQSTQMIGAGEEDSGQYRNIQNCDYLPGCSLLFRTSVIESVGYMPEQYFMYFEETDWCLQIKNQGLELLYVPDALVWHRFDDDKMQSAQTVYYYNRNQRMFWFKYSTAAGKLKIVLNTFFLELPRAQIALMAASSKEQKAVFKSHRKSALDFLLGRVGA